ncbi:glycosyl transferase WbpL [Beggiatoa sp. PS]|nr:glycosyl transferase WbpL [Beggiatoa sp. PS]
MIPTLMVVAFLVSALLTRYFSHPETPFCILDTPNARSLHSHPIPKSGGIAILTGFVIAALLAYWLFVPVPGYFWILMAGSLIAIISFY